MLLHFSRGRGNIISVSAQKNRTKQKKRYFIMKIALVGYGGMGRHHLYCIRNAKANGVDIEVKGIYDILPEKREEAKREGYVAYETLEELVSDPELAAVLIATPNDTHFPILKEAATHGKHVLCEKPVACSLEEAKQMYTFAREHGVCLSVHQNRRFDKDYLTVCKIVENGDIGKVYRIESTVAGSNGIPGEWRRVKKQGGGMMLDWGVHLIDQMRVFFGNPEKITHRFSYNAGEEVEDGFFTILDYKGLEVFIDNDTNCFVHRPRWTLFGTEGTAQILDWDLSGEIVRVKQRHDANLKGITAGNGMTKTMAPRSEETIERLPLPEVTFDPFAYYKNLIAIAEGKAEPIAKENEVLDVMSLMEGNVRK